MYVTGGPHGGGQGFSFYGKMKFRRASVCIQYFEYYGRATIPIVVSPGGERVGSEEIEMSITKKTQASQRHRMRSTDDGRDMAP